MADHRRDEIARLRAGRRHRAERRAPRVPLEVPARLGRAVELGEVDRVTPVHGVVEPDRPCPSPAWPPRTGRTPAARTSAAREPERRCRSDVDDPRAPFGHPLELLDRLVDDRHADRRRREDRVLVPERPVLVHPLVERVQDRMRCERVVGHRLFDDARAASATSGPASMPNSCISLYRGSTSKNASRPAIERRSSGSSCWPPGGATRRKVGFGMARLIRSLTASFVRRSYSMYLTMPSYSGGRNFVKASGFSYMWLSASKTG